MKSLKSLKLKGVIDSDDNAFFFTSDLGGDYIISMNKNIQKILPSLDKKTVNIKAKVIGSKIHIESIEEPVSRS